MDRISTTSGVELGQGGKLVWQDDDHNSNQLRQRQERFRPGRRNVADA